jgi:transposase
MFTVELYAKIRRAVMVDGLSRREAARRFGIHRNTIAKMLQFSVPPGYRRQERPVSKKLGPHMAWIDAVLEGDRSVHKKQRHTASRIFERLRDEQGFSGGYTIVREYVAGATLRSREMFIPLSHRPGHAQADFGEADGYICGKKVRFHYFCMDLPHSDGCFVKAYPAETAEAFCDGHVAAFDFFGGVPQSILYDNLWTPPAARGIFWCRRHGMRESIRPVAGAIAPLALMGVRRLWPHNTIGLEGLVVDQAPRLRPLPTCHQCPPRILFLPSAQYCRALIRQLHIPRSVPTAPKQCGPSCWRVRRSRG